MTFQHPRRESAGCRGFSWLFVVAAISRGRPRQMVASPKTDAVR
jgi:hypothetical protein